MKKQFTLSIFAVLFSLAAFAQDTLVKPKYDTSKWDISNADTTIIGNILFIKMKKKNGEDSTKTLIVEKQKSSKRVTTKWMAFDLGFSNFTDKSNYAATGSYLVNKPGSPAFSKDDFDPKTGRSINVNIWPVVQEIHLIKTNINLKYALGLELNNYFFKSPLSFKESGTVPYSGVQTNAPFVFRDSITFKKNKLGLDYITLPIMLNFRDNKDLFNFSAGVSFGYLYRQKNKQVSEARGKQKERGSLGLEKFKMSYVAEIGYGDYALYASYSPKTMFEKSLDIQPYSFGLRFNFF